MAENVLRKLAPVLALAVLPWLPQAAPGASMDRNQAYVVFVEVLEPREDSRAALQKMLKAEGYDAQPEGDSELALVLTAGEIRKLFGARVVHRRMEKSATHGTALHPALEGARIPERFQKLMRRVYFDAQRG